MTAPAFVRPPVSATPPPPAAPIPAAGDRRGSAPGVRGSGTAKAAGRLGPAVAAPAVAAPAAAAIRRGFVSARRLAPAAAVLLTVLAVHVALAPHLGVLGLAPDVPLVAVVAVAAGRGRRAGAAFGFAAGLGADLFLVTPLGTSALAYTLVGHVVGAAAAHDRRGGPVPALCSPASRCFACRTGRRTAARPSDRRRAAVRRGVVLTAGGVVAGRLAAALASTALGGVPFPGARGLVRIGVVAVLSAPLGVPALAGVRRLAGGARPAGGG